METVTARLVGMEINANSSVTSPPGRASEDAHLQMAKSAVTEVCLSYSLLHNWGGKKLLIITPSFFVYFLPCESHLL